MNIQNQIHLVTGTTSGIGRVTALELARLGATVIMVARDHQRGEQVAAEIKTATGNDKIDLRLADLASLDQVRQLADGVKQDYPHLHVLINNAGAIIPKRELTADGYEMTFGVNHLAPFLLTNLLLDLLEAGAPARIINVSSGAHVTGKIDFDDLQGEKGWSSWRAYNQSKLANILFTYELDRRLNGNGVTANCLHPGLVATSFGGQAQGLSALFMTLARPFSLTPEQGAETVLYLASSPEVNGISGQYFSKKQVAHSSKASHDLDTARRLWQISETLVGLPDG